MRTRGAAWIQNLLKEVPSQCCRVGSCTRVRQGIGDLREEPSSELTQSQELPAEGKPPQTPTTRGHAARHSSRTHHHPPKGCSAHGFCLCQWDAPQPLLHLHLAAKASSTQGNILPVGCEEVGAAAAVLLLCAALSSVCNYPKHRVMRHNLQSLQLFGIPLYWLTDRTGSRMQQIETAL